MFGYELNLRIAPLSGGDAVDGAVFVGFRLSLNGEDVASDFTVDAEDEQPDPETIMNLLPLPLFNACLEGKPVAVTQGQDGLVWFRFVRTASDQEEDQDYRFIDDHGKTVEVCRTCGRFYAPYGDGFDGECATCADARFAKEEHPDEDEGEEQGVTLTATSYEWDCPRCNTAHQTERTSSVTCAGCGRTFTVDDLAHSN